MNGYITKYWLKVVLLALNVLLTIQLANASSTIPSGQLPMNVEPLHYLLEFKLDPQQTTFSGTSHIKIKITKTSSVIYLHGQDLTINNVSITDNNKVKISAKADKTEVDGVLKIVPVNPLPSGVYQLVIEYVAPFNENLQGLHRIKDGEQYYAFSQMEAIYARYAFPSFDEPRFKTRFDLKVTIPQNLIAISNSPEVKVHQLNNGWKQVDYATSKPMPTYLFALAVGDFDVVTSADLPATKVRKRPLALRGIATKGKGGKLKYALEHTQEILESLEDYFQMEYPYQKLDILAVPDFAAGAMENPGAITYREQLLLLDDDSSIDQKRRYKSVHAHELAHQWFGNLVTPKWWNDIWLNEAFATWMAATALDRSWPDEQWRRQQIQRSKQAMNSDSIPSARKVRNPIETNSDIVTAFDGITYRKGSGVLSMVESFMGKENFRLGVQKYMHKYEWKNADAFDFFQTIASVLPKERADKVVQSFRNFVEQAGVPLLNIKKTCTDEHTQLVIQQERYTPLGTEFKDKTLWNIPACLSYQVDGEIKQQCEVISKHMQTVKLNSSGCADWVMPNSQATGYYRFNFDSMGWQSLLANLNKLDPLEANAAIDSMTSSFNSGNLTVTELIEVIPTTLTSDSWEVVTSGMSTLKSLIDYAEESEKLELRKISADIYRQSTNNLGFTDDTAFDKSNSLDANNLRSRLIDFMANTAKDTVYRAQLTEMASNYIGFKTDGKFHDDAIISALRTTAMEVAVEELGRPFVDALVVHLKASSDGTLRGRIISALTSTEDPEIAAELIAYSLSNDLRDNEKSTVLFSLITNKELDEVMWPWLTSNFDQLVLNLPTNYQSWLPYLLMNDCDENVVKRLDEFLQPRLDKLVGADRNFVKVKDQLKQCLAQKAHVKPQISAFLKHAL